MSDTDIELGPACEAVIKESKRITPETSDEVRHIVLEVSEPSFRFVEGQTIGIVIPGPHEFGNQYHMRRYSIANARDNAAGETVELDILVRRCFYIDEVNGESYPGIASNFLCDAGVGQKISITGPYRSPFKIPADRSSNLLMIGTGTGVAPFRAFVQRIYKEGIGWNGKVRLFYGARNGMELLYMNDQNDDLANYYDEASFKAFNAIVSRPLATEQDALERSISDNIDEAWELIQQPNTVVFMAGLKKTSSATDKALIEKAGSKDGWNEIKQRLIDEGRWSELLY